ncbi:WbqC family protein [Hymenobacter chitinivorans]|uniref:WbqC-like protein n=1 Tax=Hymenobacter chitinivorans DSM 11115 TaxID=1121954 RepID=A0A2M9BM35_9BACT|nr:WbqC family protein [Hymenobacter chitinivorans]PJJ58985.1 WbqC-like protein [Hymenobacter chitinivorans DSM 11115]
MRLAIMQPYLFPYLGYYQLLAAVDRFVIYDDVQFMLQGWINRNYILVNGKPLLFTLPLEATSANKSIRDTTVNPKLFPTWATKFTRTLQQNYSKAPYLAPVLEMVDTVLASASGQSIADVSTESIRQVHRYLGLQSQIVPTSTGYQNTHLSGPTRVLDICRQEGADHYINPINGRSLYDEAAFAQEGIKLNFLQMEPVPYKQLKGEFVPSLSILDVLMFNAPAAVHELLQAYTLA